MSFEDLCVYNTTRLIRQMTTISIFRFYLQAILLIEMPVGSQTVILNLARLLLHLHFHKELGKSQE